MNQSLYLENNLVLMLTAKNMSSGRFIRLKNLKYYGSSIELRTRRLEDARSPLLIFIVVCLF
jgi:hypothetical protein